jgi:DeoR/GlpR family transcriptional regulator of sugar metabolism
MSVDPVELRRTAVLNVLREGDASIEEIAQRMNANYYTIRKSVIELSELGLAHRTGFPA